MVVCVCVLVVVFFFFFFQAEDGIRDYKVTGVQTCALPILERVIVVATKLVKIVMIKAVINPAKSLAKNLAKNQIGRASCRERV